MADWKKTFGAGATALWLGLAPVTFHDGVYRDLAEGYNGDVIVRVVVRDGRIVSLSAKNREGGESEYFKKAEAGLADAIVQNQGIDGVEAVAGATGTSESILNAMRGIMEQMGYAGEDEAGEHES